MQPLLVVYGSSGWQISALEVVGGAGCRLDGQSPCWVMEESILVLLLGWGALSSAKRAEKWSVVLAASVDRCKCLLSCQPDSRI